MLVVAGVAVGAHPEQADVEQTQRQRQHAAMAQPFTAVGEPELDPSAQRRLSAAKRLHVVELQLVALMSPRGVVPVLLAAAAVEARRLQVSVGAGRDPNRGPG